MMRNSKSGAVGFFLSIPDDLLVEIAIHDWKSLEILCMALSVDLQLLKEDLNESPSNWGDLC